MKLQTQIKIPQQRHNQIDYQSKLLLLGSCFSDNIFQKLSHYKFCAKANPLGTQFHAVGIERLITRAINQDYYTEAELCKVDDVYYSFDAHSKLNSEDAAELCQKLNKQLDHTLEWLKLSSHIVITLGTAWVYRHISRDTIVSNCHKVPQKQFLKELLPIKTISESLDSIMALVKELNPEVTFIYTVSPIRHLKDGLVENNRSKAHLLSAIHQIVDPREGSYYFPSYEIQMDELRDYRFYDIDMLHPSQQAIAIIWERFSATWLTDEAINLKKRIEHILAKQAHRPFQPNSAAHQKFLAKLNSEIEAIKRELPHTKFD